MKVVTPAETTPSLKVLCAVCKNAEPTPAARRFDALQRLIEDHRTDDSARVSAEGPVYLRLSDTPEKAYLLNESIALTEGLLRDVSDFLVQGEALLTVPMAYRRVLGETRITALCAPVTELLPYVAWVITPVETLKVRGMQHTYHPFGYRPMATHYEPPEVDKRKPERSYRFVEQATVDAVSCIEPGKPATAAEPAEGQGEMLAEAAA